MGDYNEKFLWGDTSEFGLGWEERIYNKIIQAYPQSERFFGKNPYGDIDTGSILLEVKAEKKSAESKRVMIEYQRCIPIEGTFQFNKVQSGLTITKSKYYIHCDTNDFIIVTRVDYLRKYIEKFKNDLIWEINARYNQGGYDTYYDTVFILLDRFKHMAGLLEFSAYCNYNEFDADFIKKWII